MHLDPRTLESLTAWIDRYRLLHEQQFRTLDTVLSSISTNQTSSNGVVHVARTNELIIQTFEFEGYPDVVSLETLPLKDLGEGRTLLSAHSVYPSIEARDGMAESGMEQGVTEGYDKLDEVLANLSVSH